MTGRVRIPDRAAHRVPDDGEPVEAEVVDEGLHVADVGVGEVVPPGIPIAVAAAAEVRRDDQMVARQRSRDGVPGVGVASQSVQGQHRGTSTVTPHEVPLVQAVD